MVVGECVGLNPQISHCVYAPARAYVHMGHGVVVGVGMECVVVEPHTLLEDLLPFGRGSKSSSISESASKAFEDEDVDWGGGGGL